MTRFDAFDTYERHLIHAALYSLGCPPDDADADKWHALTNEAGEAATDARNAAGSVANESQEAAA